MTFVNISGKVNDVTQDIITLSQQSPRYKAIKNIPGFGLSLTAAIASEVGSGQQFQNGRQFLVRASGKPENIEMNSVEHNENYILPSIFILTNSSAL